MSVLVRCDVQLLEGYWRLEFECMSVCSLIVRLDGDKLDLHWFAQGRGKMPQVHGYGGGDKAPGGIGRSTDVGEVIRHREGGAGALMWGRR